MDYYIFFEGDISGETTKKLVSAIDVATEKKGIEKIVIFFSSYGGSIDEGFLLASVIQNSKIPIFMHATNHIDSIANVIYLSTKERTAESYAKFYFHGATQSGRYDEKGLKDALSAVQTSNSRIAYFVSENSKVNLKEVQELMEVGTTLSAQEALDHGIINQIVHTEIPASAERENIIKID